MRTKLTFVALALAALSISLSAQAPASGYLLPPKAIVDILDAPPPPTGELSPSRDTIVLLERSSMPTIAELSRPMLRLAGVRINPRTNGPHRSQNRYRNFTLKTISDGADRKIIGMPANPEIAWVGYSADGKRFAFTNTKDNGIELWTVDAATGQARMLANAQLNNALGDGPCKWITDGASLLCSFIVPTRGNPPAKSEVPSGPNIQENRGKSTPEPTYEDMLASKHDEDLFEYYATSQLAVVDAASGQRTPIGKPAIFEDFGVSPDGNYILVERVKRPFSWHVPHGSFPAVTEVWDRKGTIVKAVVDAPSGEGLTRGAVRTGPRNVKWHPIQPATLAWTEALDGGDPQSKVTPRDKVVTLAAPFTAAPADYAKAPWRLQNVTFTSAGLGLITETDRATRKTRTSIIDAPGATPRKLVERSSEDSYANPGTPLPQLRVSNLSAPFQVGDNIYMTGVGASPTGDHPFLDRVNLKTGAKERIFQSEAGGYETVTGLLTDDGSKFVTRYETRNSPPNIAFRGREAGSRRVVSSYGDPAPALQGVKSQMVTYTRKDGVQLRMTIYTPPGWTPDKGRLPALLWAYPQEFTDPTMAGQVTGSQDRFTTPGWGTLHMMFLTQGYAILDDPKMPIIGPGETANDTYIEQLVSSAQAAVDKAVDMGIVDRDRVVAGGHSYGAFMTANLLAHSHIFRAGIARSGAYNRTLTPFGFQNEQRTFWQAPDLYGKMSPFYYADKITEPLLLIHGEADDNTGTFPIQSERFYAALKGHGATVRYVTLPAEAHGYTARESILHTVAEMLNWANEWAKNAKPRTTSSQQQQ